MRRRRRGPEGHPEASAPAVIPARDFEEALSFANGIAYALAGGPDYLLQFLEPRVVTENTLRHGFAPLPGEE